MKSSKLSLARIYHIFIASWYYPRWWNYILLPFTLFYYLIILLRRLLYQFKLFKCYQSTVPIIIVGNITVGGTGKTPIVIYLVEQLRQHGYRPAVISHGYSRYTKDLQFVSTNSLAHEVGDEPLLIKQRTLCPVIVCHKRTLAIKVALEKTNCNLIICDDGLQDYALARDIEIVVVDGIRRLGNGMLLPAGPLREAETRLLEVDFVINNGAKMPKEVSMYLKADKIVNLLTRETFSSASFIDQTVHAVAGIGNPTRFFNTLTALGIKVIPHAFPDHYFYTLNDLNFNDDIPVLMTEKDMVKCYTFANKKMYYVIVSAQITGPFIQQLLTRLALCLKK